MKNSDGLWSVLKQITEKEIPWAIPEYTKNDATPWEYRLIGDEIQLFPAPDYNSTDGLKVYFDRTSHDFVSSDTTAVPGFASPYHDLVAIGASIEWLKAKRPDARTLQELKLDWQRGKQEITDFYSQRNKDNKTIIQPYQRVYK